MTTFVNELENASRGGRFIPTDTVLTLTAKAARSMISMELVAVGEVSEDSPDVWVKWGAPRLIEALRHAYPSQSTQHFQTKAARWNDLRDRLSKVEAIRLHDSAGPTNHLRVTMLQPLVQAVADLGEPPGENADKLITELVRGFTAPTNGHRLKDSQKRFQNKLAEQVEHARTFARNSARRLDMQTFNTCLVKVMAAYERHHAETAEYCLIAKPTSSSSRDDKKAKSGEAKVGH